MKKLLFILTFASLALVSCNERPYQSGQVVVQPYQEPNVSVTPEVANLGDNLNLQALGELVKNSTSAQDIESKLNTSGSINNLDLNGDGSVDYIKVTEYGSGDQRGFSFTVDLPNNETQEIATIEVSKANNGAQMNIQGNQNLYGNNGYYQSHYSVGDLMIMHYLFTYHRPYYSPYRYGYYPSYYHSYRSVPVTSYRSRVVTTTKTTKLTNSPRPTTTSNSIKSPNANKVSSSVSSRAKSYTASNTSQKSFSTTSAARQRPTTSGFGNKNSTTTSKPKSSWNTSSSSSSRRSSLSSSSSSRRSSSSSSSRRRRSDERFKTNIQPLKNSLGKIIKLEGVSYDWRITDFPEEHFTNVKQNGLIAQDLEKVFPNLVETRTDGYKEVDYVSLIPTLIEAIKDLKELNDKQAKEINSLREDLKDATKNQDKLVKGLRAL